VKEITYEQLKKEFYGNQYDFCFDYPNWYRYIASKKYKIMVELGNYYGWSCCFLAKERLQYSSDFSIYAIDLHDHLLVEESLNAGYSNLEFVRKRQFRIFQQNMEKHGLQDYILPTKCCSWLAAEQFADNSVDFVFIDADHTYESVKKDIVSWLPKVKPSGIISGHDYLCGHGVADAVKEILGSAYTVWNEGASNHSDFSSFLRSEKNFCSGCASRATGQKL
jgi:predicted O-methyltransferase YrrM